MLRIRQMTGDDVPLGMRLKDAAGWNQAETDWRRLLALDPQGCFVAEWDGRPAATTCVTVFGPARTGVGDAGRAREQAGPVAWISMVLVDPPVRGRGIATRLMEHALAHLDGRGVPTVRLDATPLGRPVYERLGFVAEYEVARWEGVAAAGAGPAPAREGGLSASHQDDLPAAGGLPRLPEPACGDGARRVVVPVGAAEMDAVAALDAAVAGADRRRLLVLLLAERADAMKVILRGGRAAGYSHIRVGSRALQIGPVISLDEQCGLALADDALLACAGRPVFVDVPLPNVAATRWAEGRGLRVQRQFTRMRRGRPAPDQPERIWASFGPEKG